MTNNEAIEILQELDGQIYETQQAALRVAFSALSENDWLRENIKSLMQASREKIKLNEKFNELTEEWFWKHENHIIEMENQNEELKEEIKRLKDKILKAKKELIKQGEYCLENDVRKYEGLLLAEKIFEKHLAECNNDCGNCLWLECPTENKEGI